MKIQHNETHSYKKKKKKKNCPFFQNSGVLETSRVFDLVLEWGKLCFRAGSYVEKSRLESGECGRAACTKLAKVRVIELQARSRSRRCRAQSSGGSFAVCDRVGVDVVGSSPRPFSSLGARPALRDSNRQTDRLPALYYFFKPRTTELVVSRSTLIALVLARRPTNLPPVRFIQC